MKSVVLDASAVLAAVGGEPGSEQVIADAPGSLLSAVNLFEVLAKAGDKGLSRSEAERQVRRLEISIVPFDGEQAVVASGIDPGSGPRRLSLADRACLSLAMHRKLPVLTGDRVWAELDLGIDIRLIR